MLARAPVFDGHNDLAWALRKQVAYDLDARDIALQQPALHTDIPRLRAGGVGAQFFSVYVPGTLVGGRGGDRDARTDRLRRGGLSRATRRPSWPRGRAAEVRAAIAGGRIAALHGRRGRAQHRLARWACCGCFAGSASPT